MGIPYEFAMNILQRKVSLGVWFKPKVLQGFQLTETKSVKSRSRGHDDKKQRATDKHRDNAQ